jgi:hypothetical protein
MKMIRLLVLMCVTLFACVACGPSPESGGEKGAVAFGGIYDLERYVVEDTCYGGSGDGGNALFLVHQDRDGDDLPLKEFVMRRQNSYEGWQDWFESAIDEDHANHFSVEIADPTPSSTFFGYTGNFEDADGDGAIDWMNGFYRYVYEVGHCDPEETKPKHVWIRAEGPRVGDE